MNSLLILSIVMKILTFACGVFCAFLFVLCIQAHHIGFAIIEGLLMLLNAYAYYKLILLIPKKVQSK